MSSSRFACVFVLLAIGCSGAAERSEGPESLKLKQAAANDAAAGKAAPNDPCSERRWYGDGECDSFCAHPDSDCVAPTPGDGIVCAAFIEEADGVCRRPKDDPCRSQDPDCAAGSGGAGKPGVEDPTACTLLLEVADGVCSRPAADPCRLQDPDCASGGSSGSGGASSGGSTSGGSTSAGAAGAGVEEPEPPLYDCDPRKITCQTLVAVTCPKGEVPTVVDACYGKCVPQDRCEPIACLAYIEEADGVCSRPSNDPCRSQDPDCAPDGVVCALYIEESDGKCSRSEKDPCRSQDPDCVSR